ncbi:MAG: ABC transporter ATP-binding protein [Albidovulum sp.]|uniref:ATP-binding cassette domain-containing protein n=1 Tax=Albidovulum sp. TaxID=1872424 RepID=UPI003C9A11C9
MSSFLTHSGFVLASIRAIGPLFYGYLGLQLSARIALLLVPAILTLDLKTFVETRPIAVVVLPLALALMVFVGYRAAENSLRNRIRTAVVDLSNRKIRSTMAALLENRRFHEAVPVADIVTATARYAQDLTMLIFGFADHVLMLVVQLVFSSLMIVFLVGWEFLALTFTILAAAAAANMMAAQTMTVRIQTAIATNFRFNEAVLDQLANLNAILGAGFAEAEIDRFDAMARRKHLDADAAHRAIAAYAALQAGVIGIVLFAVALFSLARFHADALDVGQILVFMFYLAAIILPLTSAAFFFRTMHEGYGIARTFEVPSEPGAPSPVVDRDADLPAPGTSTRFVIRDIRFSDGTALPDQDFKLYAGKVHLLLAPNGAGKTTILKIVAGAYRQGELSCSLNVDGPRYASLHYLPQEVTVFDRSIGENVFVADPDGSCLQQQDICDGFCALLGWPCFDLTRPAGTLSGGQKQKVLILRALQNKPALLILDEPTSYLDGVSCDHLFVTLTQSLPGTTILYTAHDEKITERADRRILLAGEA